MSASNKTWVWRMGWRDGRRGLRPLFFSMIASFWPCFGGRRFSFRKTCIECPCSVERPARRRSRVERSESFSQTTKRDRVDRRDQSRQSLYLDAYSPRAALRWCRCRLSVNSLLWRALKEPAAGMRLPRGANALVDDNLMLQFNSKSRPHQDRDYVFVSRHRPLCSAA